MKKLLCILLSVLLTFGGFAFSFTAFAAQEESTDALTASAFLPVRQERTASAGGSTDKIISTFSYDGNGRLLKKTVTSKYSYGTEKNVIEYTYDTKGNLVKRIDSSVDADGNTQKETMNAVYAANGNLTEKVFYDKSGDGYSRTRTSKYTYDEKNRVSSKTYTVKDSDERSTSEKTDYTYDGEGRTVGISLTFKSGGSTVRTEQTEREYGVNGLISEILTEKNNYGDKSVQTLSRVYDVDGRLISEQTEHEYNDYSYAEITEYTYNKKGKIKEKVFSEREGEDVSVTETAEYAYDAYERLTSETHFSDDITTVISYSAKGNVIKETVKAVSSKGVSTDSVTTYSYDSSSRPTRKIIVKTDADGTYTFTQNIKYDESGRLIKKTETTEYPDGDIMSSTHTVTYDINGCAVNESTVEKLNGKTTVSEAVVSTYMSSGRTVYTDSETGMSFMLLERYALSGTSVNPNIMIAKTGYELDPLMRGVDYRLSFSNNTAVGTGTAKVTFLGEYGELPEKQIPFVISVNQVKGIKTSAFKPTELTIEWNPVNGASYYRVERSVDGKKWTLLNSSVTKSTYTATGLKPATQYRFRVTPLDKNKKSAGKTSVVLYAITLTYSPQTVLKAEKGGAVTVSWKKLTGAKSYAVFKSEDGKSWTRVTETDRLTYTLTKLSAGKKLYIRVTGFNPAGRESFPSACKNVTVKK